MPVPDKRLGISVRDEVRQQQRDIADLKNTKANAGVTLPVQLGTPPGVLTDEQAAGLMNNLGTTNRVVMDHDRRIIELERLAEIGKGIATEFAGVSKDTLVTEAGKKIHEQVNDALDRANEAAASLERANSAMPGIAARVAED
ncbi:unnamed protein product, partial [marine sediment metagenome]